MPTTVSLKANLAKGDLFAISLNDECTQKLIMQVDKVDEERHIQGQVPDIFIDESVRKTFTMISIIPKHYMVQKVADRDVSEKKFSFRF